MDRLNIPPRVRARRRNLLTGAGVAAMLMIATPAFGQDVATQADWNSAVAAVAAAGAGSTVTINITSGFTLTGSLAALQANNPNVTIVITGNGQTINGATTFQGIQVLGTNAPTVNISNLSIINTRAVGGTGADGQNGFYSAALSYGSGGGGGGGAGAGGGLFVGTGANVTLSAVTFTGNNATGGNGGNGGVAQNGASSPTGGNGGAGGTLNSGSGSIGGGGAGGLGGNTGTQGTAGTAGPSTGTGGGGGGGSGTTNSTSYTSNNAGGTGTQGGGGGRPGGDGVTNNNGSQGPGADGGSGGNGGTGEGGAIFVATGATLTILDTGISGATVTGGTGGANGFGQGPSSINGAPGATGAAQGQALFIGSATATVGVSTGNNVTYANTIAGTGSLTKTGAGTLILTGANTYAGGTAINGGILNVGSTGAIGAAGTISFAGGTLQYSAANQTNYSARFSNAANQAYSIDTNGQNVAYTSALTSANGSLTKLGAGTLTLSGANTFGGPVTVNGGTLQLLGGAAIADASAVSVNGTGTLLVSASETIGSLAGDGAVRFRAPRSP